MEQSQHYGSAFDDVRTDFCGRRGSRRSDSSGNFQSPGCARRKELRKRWPVVAGAQFTSNSGNGCCSVTEACGYSAEEESLSIRRSNSLATF
jgi:hypothetical protein